MSGRHGKKKKKQQVQYIAVKREDQSSAEVLCQKHPDRDDEEIMAYSEPLHKPPDSKVSVWTLVVAVIVAVIYALQLRSMQTSVDLSRKAMQIDQRAWLYPGIPNFFPVNGPNIPATIQISNIGKTVAMNIAGHAVATVIKKGDTPALDQYVGHLHRNIYMGALYPSPAQQPLPVPLIIEKYSDKTEKQSTPIVPDEEFQRQMHDGKAFIILFGEIHYCDVFGVQHWVKFCNGSGGAISMDGIKECIYYNRADDETTPTPTCNYSIPPN